MSETEAPIVSTSPQPRKLVLFIVAVLLSVASVLMVMRWTDLPRETAYMTGIFVLAALLWMTEALPLFATALAVIGLQILLLANPGNWTGLGFETAPSPEFRTILAAAIDPVLVLFFGGFLLAQAAVKEGIDRALANLILHPFGTRPALLMLGIMLVTAIFSMWMSNTATTAMMITLVIPMLASIPRGSAFRKGLVLAVPFAANIGGMGTPIGSPPNAVAVGFLRTAGFPVAFYQWMLVAVPLMLGLLLFTWMLLYFMFRPGKTPIHVRVEPVKLTWRSVHVASVFAVTVLLWLSEPLHGLPAAVVALLPAIVFTATGLLDRNDINTLDWNILILIAGGISLGAGMSMTGLDRAIASSIMHSGIGFGTLLIASLVLLALGLGTFMSNTAAANLLLPIGISLAGVLGDETRFAVTLVAINIALVSSVGMALPISTPPNAIAYARGEINTKEMAVAGIIIGLLAAGLIIAFGAPVLRFWGVGE